MIAALAVFLLTVKEVSWAQEADARNRLLEAEAAPAKENEADAPKHKLSKSELISLSLILASVALWFTGYNAVTSKFSVYVEEVFVYRDAAGAVIGDSSVSYDGTLMKLLKLAVTVEMPAKPADAPAPAAPPASAK